MNIDVLKFKLPVYRHIALIYTFEKPNGEVDYNYTLRSISSFGEISSNKLNYINDLIKNNVLKVYANINPFTISGPKELRGMVRYEFRDTSNVYKKYDLFLENLECMTDQLLVDFIEYHLAPSNFTKLLARNYILDENELTHNNKNVLFDDDLNYVYNILSKKLDTFTMIDNDEYKQKLLDGIGWGDLSIFAKEYKVRGEIYLSNLKGYLVKLSSLFKNVSSNEDDVYLYFQIFYLYDRMSYCMLAIRDDEGKFKLYPHENILRTIYDLYPKALY